MITQADFPKKGNVYEETRTGIRVYVDRVESPAVVHMAYLDGRQYAYNLPAEDLQKRFRKLICYTGLWQFEVPTVPTAEILWKALWSQRCPRNGEEDLPESMSIEPEDLVAALRGW